MFVSQRMPGILPGINKNTLCRFQKKNKTGSKLWPVFTYLFFVLLTSFFQPTSAVAGSNWQAVAANQISVKLANPVVNRRSPDATVSISLANISGQTLTGPFRLVITGLTPAGKVSIGNATGTTGAGEPYFDLTGYMGANITPSGTGLVTAIVKGGGSSVFNFQTRIDQQIPQNLTVQITSPASLLTVGSTPQTVKGTVSDSAAQITINGAPVTNNNGGFQAAVTLSEGSNTVTARATDAYGHDVSDIITLSLDTTPPYITVDTPQDGNTVRTDKISVSGLVNDIVRGTVAPGQAQVTVNGIAASVSNRSYLAENVPLSQGDNTIKIVASDNVGNTSNISLKVTYQPLAPQHIELLSGQDQTAAINATLAQPLKVKLLDQNSQPVANKPVIFRVTQGDGDVGVGSQDQGPGTLVQTDANGVAATSFQLGSRAGNGNQRVRAAAVGFDGEVLFYATATVGAPNKVTVNSGNNQRGAVSQQLPQPLVVAVIDQGANVVPGAQIQFDVTQGSGKFQNGKTSITVQTDSDGRAAAELTLGAETGLDAQRATATLVGSSLYAGFTASALTVGSPGQTSISGVVLDNQDKPLPGVTVRVDGTTRQAQADAQGQFKITEAPVGSVHLIADGSTTTVPGEWPTLAFNLVTVAGADNPLSAPIYLVKLNTANAQMVGDKDVTLTLPDVPGFALDVKAGSVTFPDGKKTGQLSVTPVNVSKIPMPPPNGMQPQFIVTIQPVGAKFDPPAALTLPNADGHQPGAQVEMYSYDHDLEEFVAIGLGTVSADGRLIKSNPGVGVIKAGWHCGSQPGGSGCCTNAGECQTTDASCNVVPDNQKTPTSITDAKNDCKKPACVGGQPTQKTDPNDFDSQCSTGCSGQTPVAKNEGSSCDDGIFCTEPDTCTGGACTGKKIEDSAEQAVEFELNLKPIIGAVEQFGKIMGVETTASATYTNSGAQKNKCCEEKQQKNVPEKKLEYGLNAKLETDKIFVPALSFNIRVVKIGVYVKLGVSLSAKLSGVNDFCIDEQCWSGGLGASGGAEAGVAAEDAAKVVSLTGGLASALKLDGKTDCKSLGYAVSHDGLKGKIAFELFDGFTSVNYQVELIPGGTITSGSVPLNI